MPRFLTGFESFSPNPLSLEKMEEALRGSIIVTVATSAHTGLQIVIGQEFAPLMARKL